MAVQTKKKPYEIRQEKIKKKREEQKKKAKKYWEKRYGKGHPMSKKQEKEYSEMNTGELARAKRAMTSKKAYSAPTFKSAFADARKGGKDKFTWQGKSYHTKTKSELEGAKEREKFARAGKTKKAAPAKKGNIFSRIATKMRGGHATQAGYEEARAKRIKEKRIARMEKRKDEGKSYSTKKLAELKGDTGSKKTYITKKDKKEKKGPWITKIQGRGWRKDVKIPGIKT